MDYKNKRRNVLHKFACENKLLVSIVLFSGIVASIIIILIPISIGKYYNLLFHVTSKKSFVLDVFPEIWLGSLPNFIYFFFGLVLVWSIFSFFQHYITSKLGEILIRNLRENLFVNQLSVRMKSYDESGFGKYLLRYSGDMNSIKRFLINGVIRFTIDFILILLAIIAMLIIDMHLTLIVGIGIGLILLIVTLLNRILYRFSLDLRNQKSGLLSFVSTRLPSLLTIKILNRTSIEENDFNKRSAKVYNLSVKYQFVNNIITVIIPGILYLTIGFLLFVIYLFNENENAIQGDHLLSFILLFLTAQPVFRRILKAPSIWKLGNISFEKYFKVLELNTDKSKTDGKKFRFKKGRIQFKDVSYAYINNEDVLSNLDFEIKGEEITLINSKNNLPKSTIIKLICGIYIPTRGTVLIDGQNIKDLDLKSLRRNIGILSEDIPLLGRNVFEACSYSKAKGSRLKTQEILDFLQVDISDDMKMDLDFLIGERGDKLNLFQKQILIVARAFLVNKPILLIENLNKMESNPAFKQIFLKLQEFGDQNKTIALFEESPGERILNFKKNQYEF